MADHAHSIPEPDVHPLGGSSPPGGGAPAFEPVASGSTVDDAAPSVDAEAVALKKLIEQNEKLWTTLPDNAGDDDPVTIARHASADAIRAASDALSDREAVSDAGIGAKAATLLAALGERPDDWYSNMRDHVRLIESTLRDLVTLHGSHLATAEEYAKIGFEPWSEDCPLPPDAEWLSLAEAHFPTVRVAWLMNTKDKPTLMDSLAFVYGTGDGALLRFWDDLKGTRGFFRSIYEMCETAETRMLVALHTMQMDPNYAHCFKADEAAA